MNSRQRAYLRSLASKETSVFQIGKNALSPEITEAVSECFNTRELIKISVLNNCLEDPKELGRMLSERTGSELISVIGKKIVLYKENKDKKKIVLPD